MAWFVMLDSRNKGEENEAYLSPEIEIIPEEQERYDTLGRQHSRKLFGDYKTAGKNPYDYQLMIDDPYHPYITPFPVPCMKQGWKWPMPNQPFRNKLKRKEGKLVDIIGTSFETYAISQKVIDIIESIEPGVHQYLPYELIQKDGTAHPDKRWLLNVCTRAETLDYERSNVIPRRGAEHFYMDRTNDHRLVVRKEAMKNRALWYEYRYPFGSTSGNFLISDRFWDALNATGCTGWCPEYGDRGQHIKEL